MKLPTYIRSTVNEAIDVYIILLKILVPTILLVKALELVGGVDWLGNLLSPMMGLLGLPDAFGVVLAATMLTNIFTGLVVFASVAAEQSLTVAQMTVLGTLMLLSHSLPIEGAVAKRAGVPWRTTLTLRIGGALLLGLLIHGYFSVTGSGTDQVSLDWLPEQRQDTVWTWLASQLQTLVVIFFVILALIVLLRVLRAIKLEQLLHRMLTPPLKLLGIGPDAANVMVIGIVLGLSFGAGLLIRDVDSGKMSARDSYLALCFLGLAHSMIDDTLLIMMTGADIIICLFVRLIFAIVTVAVLSRYFGPSSPSTHETGVK